MTKIITFVAASVALFAFIFSLHALRVAIDDVKENARWSRWSDPVQCPVGGLDWGRWQQFRTNINTGEIIVRNCDSQHDHR